MSSQVTHTRSIRSTTESRASQNTGLWSKSWRWTPQFATTIQRAADFTAATCCDGSHDTMSSEQSSAHGRSFGISQSHLVQPRRAPPARGTNETIHLISMRGDARALSALFRAQSQAQHSTTPIQEMIPRDESLLDEAQRSLNAARDYFEDIHRIEVHSDLFAAGPVTCLRCFKRQTELHDPTFRSDGRDIVRGIPLNLLSQEELLDIAEQRLLGGLPLPTDPKQEDTGRPSSEDANSVHTFSQLPPQPNRHVDPLRAHPPSLRSPQPRTSSALIQPIHTHSEPERPRRNYGMSPEEYRERTNRHIRVVEWLEQVAAANTAATPIVQPTEESLGNVTQDIGTRTFLGDRQEASLISVTLLEDKTFTGELGKEPSKTQKRETMGGDLSFFEDQIFTRPDLGATMPTQISVQEQPPKKASTLPPDSDSEDQNERMSEVEFEFFERGSNARVSIQEQSADSLPLASNSSATEELAGPVVMDFNSSESNSENDNFNGDEVVFEGEIFYGDTGSRLAQGLDHPAPEWAASLSSWVPDDDPSLSNGSNGQEQEEREIEQSYISDDSSESENWRHNRHPSRNIEGDDDGSESSSSGGSDSSDEDDSEEQDRLRSRSRRRRSISPSRMEELWAFNRNFVMALPPIRPVNPVDIPLPPSPIDNPIEISLPSSRSSSPAPAYDRLHPSSEEAWVALAAINAYFLLPQYTVFSRTREVVRQSYRIRRDIDEISPFVSTAWRDVSVRRMVKRDVRDWYQMLTIQAHSMDIDWDLFPPFPPCFLEEKSQAASLVSSLNDEDEPSLEVYEVFDQDLENEPFPHPNSPTDNSQKLRTHSLLRYEIFQDDDKGDDFF